MNREPTVDEPVVELTERVETPRTCDIEPKLFAPMFALQSPKNACERVRIHEPNGNARDSLPSDLAPVVEAWPMLPDALKAAVLAIVQSAHGQTR